MASVDFPEAGQWIQAFATHLMGVEMVLKSNIRLCRVRVFGGGGEQDEHRARNLEKFIPGAERMGRAGWVSVMNDGRMGTEKGILRARKLTWHVCRRNPTPKSDKKYAQMQLLAVLQSTILMRRLTCGI